MALPFLYSSKRVTHTLKLLMPVEKKQGRQDDPPDPLLEGFGGVLEWFYIAMAGGLPPLKLFSPVGEGGNFYLEKPLSRSFFLAFTAFF